MNREVFHGVRDGFGVNYGLRRLRADSARQSEKDWTSSQMFRMQVRRIFPRIASERRPGFNRQ